MAGKGPVGSNITMMNQSSAQQLDLTNMGKSNNISVHQKSNSNSLPATFQTNFAANSQRLSQ